MGRCDPRGNPVATVSLWALIFSRDRLGLVFVLRRRNLPLIAGWTLVVMLFSHAALAASPCLGERLPAQAVVVMGAMECCAEAEGGVVGLNDNGNV